MDFVAEHIETGGFWGMGLSFLSLGVGFKTGATRSLSLQQENEIAGKTEKFPLKWAFFSLLFFLHWIGIKFALNSSGSNINYDLASALQRSGDICRLYFQMHDVCMINSII